MMLDRELVASSAEMRQGQGRLRAALSMRVCFYPHPPGEASHVQGVRKDCGFIAFGEIARSVRLV
jgi:hypothetical protein